MSTTPVFGITLGEEGQSQGWPTANELFRLIELFGGTLQFIDFGLDTPPGSPAEGDTYWTGSSPSGDWATHDAEIATYFNSEWKFYDPKSSGLDITGVWAFIDDEDHPVVFSSTTNTWAVVTRAQSESLTITDPTSSENVSLFFTNKAVTITEMRCVLQGSGSQSVTWTVKHGSSRASGTPVVTAGTTTTNITTGDDVTSFDSEAVAADSFIWVETSALVATVDEMALTVYFEETTG